jgi:hypothetical protein
LLPGESNASAGGLVEKKPRRASTTSCQGRPQRTCNRNALVTVPIIPLGFSVEDVEPFASGAGADGGAAVLSAWEAAERLAVDDRLATSGCGSGLGGPYGFIGKSIAGRLEVDMALDRGRLQGVVVGREPTGPHYILTTARLRERGRKRHSGDKAHRGGQRNQTVAVRDKGSTLDQEVFTAGEVSDITEAGTQTDVRTVDLPPCSRLTRRWSAGAARTGA